MKIERWQISPLKTKKYRVWFKSKDGKLHKVDFGAKGYAQYRDRSPLKAYAHLDHNDKQRRDRYYARHNINYPIGSADYMSKKFLW